MRMYLRETFIRLWSRNCKTSLYFPVYIRSTLETNTENFWDRTENDRLKVGRTRDECKKKKINTKKVVESALKKKSKTCREKKKALALQTNRSVCVLGTTGVYVYARACIPVFISLYLRFIILVRSPGEDGADGATKTKSVNKLNEPNATCGSASGQCVSVRTRVARAPSQVQRRRRR